MSFSWFCYIQINDDYKQILRAEKGHFHPFKMSDLDHQDPVRSYEPVICYVLGAHFN